MHADRGEPIENPITVLNAEFKDSADADGHLKAGTRLVRMSNAAYAAEKRRATEVGELWLGARFRHPHELALTALSRFGTVVPDFMHWRRDVGDDPWPTVEPYPRRSEDSRHVRMGRYDVDLEELI